MSYVAIARKWRPRSFSEIAGQGHVTQTLENAIKLGRIHHAFLFSGARGVGKTTAARTLARCLNCMDNGPRPDPCGKCACCIDLLAGKSPDVIEIDGASNNSVDDIRDLRDSVRYMPVLGRYKIYIVDEVHMLSKGAFNALLKTLEEPPPHVIFIFATTEAQKIPDTILSRVQRFDFKRIPQQVVSDYLAKICAAEGFTVPPDGLRLIARAGEGSMRDSQSLLDQVISFAGETVTTEQVSQILGLVDRKLLYDMLEGMLGGQADRCLQAIDQVYSYGYDLSEFTAEMLELLRNATLVGLSPGSRRYLDVPDDELSHLDKLAANVQSDVFVRSFQVMLDVHDQVARAPRPRLVLEMAVARLVSIRPAQPMDQLLARMSDLERGLRHGGASARARDVRGTRPRTPRNTDPDDEPDPARSSPAAVTAAAVSRASDAQPQPQASALVLSVAQQPAEDPDPQAGPSDPAPPQSSDDRQAPRLPQGATDAARFHALRRWLERAGFERDLWAHDAILLAVQPPELRIGFRSEFNVVQGRRKTRDPHLTEGLRAYFPKCTAVTVEQVNVGGQSQREANDVAYQVRVRELTAELSEHPLILRLQRSLGASLTAVTPDVAVTAAPPPGADLLESTATVDPDANMDPGVNMDPDANTDPDAELELSPAGSNNVATDPNEDLP